MNLNSTAYSQITGISKETKQEIVSTLIAYPIVLDELGISKQLTLSQSELIGYLKKQITVTEEILENKDQEIANLNEQKTLLQKKKSSLYGFGQVNLNGFNTYGAGVDYIVRDKVILGTSINFSTIQSQVGINAKIGFKIK